MSDPVKALIAELEQKGWSAKQPDGQLIFTRGDATITGHQAYVTYSVGELSTSSDWVSKMWTMREQLDFLIERMRHFADQDDKRFRTLSPTDSSGMPAWIEELDAIIEPDGTCERISITSRDYIKLLQAVNVATNVLDSIQSAKRELSTGLYDSKDVLLMVQKGAKEALAQLQSGEFPKENE